jgi:broad specificity phosphatase PhoE
MKMFIFCLSILLLASTLSAAPIVVIVRHAEKANNGGKDPDLSPAGNKRAEALACILKDALIKSIFVTEFKRTQETATPIARETKVTPTIIPANDTVALVSKLHELNGNALVVGHGNTIPGLVKELGIDMPVNISDEDYTEIFIVMGGNNPQLLRLHYP